MLKAKALEVSDAELARFEERLEKLVKVREGIRKEIKKIKLMKRNKRSMLRHP